MPLLFAYGINRFSHNVAHLPSKGLFWLETRSHLAKMCEIFSNKRDLSINVLFLPYFGEIFYPFNRSFP